MIKVLLVDDQEIIVQGMTMILNIDNDIKVVNKLNMKGSHVIIDNRIKDITGREKEICHYLSQGMNNAEIADKICVSEGTIKNNLTRILHKLELRDRTQLALFSVRNDL